MIRKLSEIKAQREKISQKCGINDYALKETLGVGSFGRVRLAFCEKNDKHHALKIMKKAKIIDSQQVDHVKGEIKILSNIKHPFIVGLSGYFQDDKCIYLVLDYVPGGELYSRLRDVDRYVCVCLLGHRTKRCQKNGIRLQMYTQSKYECKLEVIRKCVCIS